MSSRCFITWGGSTPPPAPGQLALGSHSSAITTHPDQPLPSCSSPPEGAPKLVGPSPGPLPPGAAESLLLKGSLRFLRVISQIVLLEEKKLSQTFKNIDPNLKKLYLPGKIQPMREFEEHITQLSLPYSFPTAPPLLSTVPSTTPTSKCSSPMQFAGRGCWLCTGPMAVT